VSASPGAAPAGLTPTRTPRVSARSTAQTGGARRLNPLPGPISTPLMAIYHNTHFFVNRPQYPDSAILKLKKPVNRGSTPRRGAIA
jgi:hypothetical protein